MVVIEARNVTKSFSAGDVDVQAVCGISLSVNAGEFLGIVGPSGSGKSTLLSLIGGIDTPTSGQILLEGTDLAAISDDQRTLLRRRRIGFVFQAFNLLPTLSAIENVSLPLELDGVAERQARQRAAAALESVNLAHRAGHLPSMMSGGEQQRVAVARALVIKPALVLGDEPTGNLDSKSGAGVIGLFRELVDRWQHTVVVVTHEAHVSQYADRIVRLRDGVIEEDVRLRQPRVNDPPERQVNAPQDPRESDPTEPPRPLVERRLSAGAAQPTGVNEPTAAPPKQTPGK